MVAVISGSGLGIFGSSVSALGGIGGSGNAAPGRGNDRIYVNTATGNLIVQSQDERLSALGLDLSLVRTYNSQGLLDDDNGDNWRLGVHQRLYNLTGIVNTSGSRIIKVFGDGREVTYEYSIPRNAYVSSEGADAHDTLTFSNDAWTWQEGTTRVAETYDENGRLRGARDADGNEVAYEYTGLLLTRIVDASGQQTHLDYAGNNLTAIRVVSAGVTQTLTTYAYDADDRLERVTVDLTPGNGADALFHVTTYTYDGASHRVAAISQSDGTSVELEYALIDGQYRVSTYTDGAGRVTTFNYSQPTGSGVPTGAPANGAALATIRTTSHSLDTSSLTEATGSWQAAALLETEHTDASPPRIVFDKLGNGFATWAQGTDVIARRYTAGTGTWSAPVILDSNSNDAYTPALAVDRETGAAVVAWVQSDGVASSLYARSYDVITDSWHATQLLESSSGAVQEGPDGVSVAMIDGNAAIAWVQNDGVADSIYLSRLVNDAWSSPTLLDGTNETAGWPRVAVDANGNAMVLWRQMDGEFRIHSRYWNDASQSLSAIQLLDDEGDRHPRVAFDGEGNAFAVWGGGTQVRRFDATTGEWSPQVSLQDGTGATWHADLSVDAQGNALVGWLEDDGTAVSVYARRFDSASGSWSAATLLETLTESASTDYALSVSLAGDEGVVAWVHQGSTVTDAHAARLIDGMWSTATLIESRDTPAGDIRASIDVFGNATVVWVQPDDWAPSIYQARYVSPYYVVPSGATWQSVASTLYGVNSVAAGNALQAVMGGGSLSAGIRLSGLPATLSVTSTVPAYYTVRAGDTWAHITFAIYGTTDVNAIAQLQSALGSPNLVVGLDLTVPANVSYTTSGSYTAPLNFGATSTTQSQSYTLIPGAGTTPPASWSAAALLETGNEEARGPQVAFDAAGNGIAVWGQGSDIIIRRFAASTGTWSAAVILDASTYETGWPILSVDRQTGNAIVAWTQSDGVADSLYARHYNAATNTWSPARLVESSAGAVNIYPLGSSIALVGEHAAIAWMQDDGTTGSVYLSRLENGAWTAPTLLDVTDEEAMEPQVAIDAAGNTTVLWRQHVATDFEFRIHAVRWNAATQSYGDIQLLDDDGDRYPRLAFDAAGNGFAVWGGGAQVRRFDASTGTWGPQVSLDNGSGAVAEEIAIDAAGNALLAWIADDGDTRSVYARRYDVATGTWGAPTLIENRTLPATIEERLAVAISGGEAVVTWVEDTGATRDVYAVNLSGGAWSAPALLESRDESGGQLSAAVDAAGNVMIVWLQPDGTAPSIYQAHLSRVPYYTVPSGATWQSIAHALYGVSSPAAGSALQAAMGSPTLTAGLQLQFLPATLVVTVTVPPHYVVQSGDIWSSITNTLYGTTDAVAVAALQSALGNPTLAAGLSLNVPSTLDYSRGATGGGAASYLQTDVTAYGVTTRYEQDASGRLVAMTVAPDSLAERTEYEYDADGNVTAIVRDPGGLNRVMRMTYDGNGNLLSQRDDLGNTLARTYDANNQLLTETVYEVRDPDGAGGQTPSLPLTTHYAYDSEQHLRFTVSSAGRVTEHRYNDEGERETMFTYTGAFYTGGEFDITSLASWAAARDRTQLQRVDYAYDFRGNLSSMTAFRTTDGSGAGTGTPSVTHFVYDQRGQLLQTVEARGGETDAGNINVPYATTYSYDGLGRVLSVSQWNAAGNVSTTLTAYDDANRATRVTLANGLVTTTLHGLGGEVISVANGTAAAPASLGATTYTYDANGRLRIQTDPTGVRQFIEYDAAGRRIAQIDGDGTLTEFIHDDLGRVIKTVQYSTRVDSATLASLVDGNGQRTAVGLAAIRASADDTPSHDRITRSVYDAAGLLVYEIDATGAVTQYFYDGAGRVTDEVRYAREVSIPASVDQVLDGSFAITYSPELDRRSRHFYDADGLRVGTLDAEGYLVEIKYDAAGRMTAQVGYANRTASSLWLAGTLQQLRDSAGIDDELALDPERDELSYFFYDGRGNRIGARDAEGYLTEFIYDVADRLIERRRYDINLTYTPGSDDFDSLKLAASQAAVVHSISYQYDGAGRVVRETNHEGTVTDFNYDAVGQRVATTVGFETGEARQARARYDLLGRVVQELSAEGSALIAQGMTQPQIDEIWNRYGVSYAYDAAGRRVSATVRPNDAQTNTTFYFYDADGRLRFEVNAKGEVLERRYDAFGQLTETIGYADVIATGGLTGGLLTTALEQSVANIADASRDVRSSMTYTLRGQLRSILSAEGALTSYTYDAFGEERTRSQQLTGTTTLEHEFTYDRRSQLTGTRWDPLGLNTSEGRSYDAFGRLTSVTDANGNVSRMQYDRLGRTIVTISGVGSTHRAAYDAFARVLRTSTDGLPGETRYTYDDVARSVVVTTPEGVSVSTVNNRHGQTLSVLAAGNLTEYHYDRNGALLRVSDDLGTLEERTYDRAGRQLTATDARGVVTSFAYDAANRMFSRTVDTGGLALTTTYLYDTQGRVRLVTEPNGTQTETIHDRDGRITAVIVDPNGPSRQATTYEYDLAGRRIAVITGAGTNQASRTEYIYDTLGRLVEQIVDFGAGTNPLTQRPYLNLTTRYRYDANGNLTRKIDANGHSTWYVFDAADRLTHTIDTLGGVTRSKYDVENRVVLTERYATALTAQTMQTLATLDVVRTANFSVVTSTRDRRTQHVYDGDGREVYTIDALYGVTQRTFDANGNVTRERMLADPVGVAEYASSAQLALVLGNAVDTIGARDRVRWTTYDLRGRAEFTVDGAGAVTRNEFDGNGNVVATTAYAVPRSISLATDYAALDTWADTHANDTGNRVTRYWYDAANRRRFVLDAEGYLSEIRYHDASRTETRIVYSDTPGPLVSATLAQVASAASEIADGNLDQTTVTLYDAAGRQKRVTDSFGNYEEYSYDAVGNRIGYRNKAGAVWMYEYDANDRLIYERSPAVRITRIVESGGALSIDPASADAPIVMHIQYDALGNVRFRTEAAGTSQARTTEYRYDALGRQVMVRHPQVGVYDVSGDTQLGNGAAIVRTETDEILYSEIAYDTLGNAFRSRDVADNYSYKTYDNLGRVELEIDALGYVTRYGYDTFGNREQLTRYATALLGALPREGSRLLTSEVSNLIVEKPSEDRVLVSTYDRLNRLVTVTQPQVFNFSPAAGSPGGATSTASATTVHEYDAFGQVFRTRQLVDAATNSYADTYFYYDRRGLKTAQVDALNHLTVYGYDETGDLVRQVEYARPLAATPTRESYGTAVITTPQTLPDSAVGYDRETTFRYDRLNRLVEEIRRAVEYTPANSATLVTAFHDQLTTYGHDAVGNRTRVSQHYLDAAGQPAVNHTYTYYDVLGRVVALAEPSRDAGGGNTLVPLTIMYRDAYGNLVGETRYAGGAVGTVTEAAIPSAAASATPDRTTLLLLDEHGRAIQTQDATGANRHASYDKRGQVAKEWQRVTNDGTTGWLVTLYRHDELGRQTTVIEPQRYDGGSTVSIERSSTYNAFGEVTARGIVDNSATSGRQEFFDYDRAGRLWRTNADDGITKVYLHDLPGNVTAEIRSQGRDLSSVANAATAAAFTSDVMRTEMRYDVLGREVERRLPTFTTTDGIEPINVTFDIANGIAGPANASAIYRLITIDYGTGPMDIYVVDPTATLAEGGGYYINEQGFYVQDPNHLILSSVRITWAAPSDAGIEPLFEYRAQGSNDPNAWGRVPVGMLAGNKLGVDVSGLMGQTYEYRVTYRRRTETAAYAQATGTFRVDGTGSSSLSIAATPPDAAATIPALNPTYTGGVMSWAAPADASVQATVRVRAGGEFQSVTAQRQGNSFVANLSQALSQEGNYTYEVIYTRDSNGSPVVVGKNTGQLYSSGTTYPRVISDTSHNDTTYIPPLDSVPAPTAQGSVIGAVIVDSEISTTMPPSGVPGDVTNPNLPRWIEWGGSNLVNLSWDSVGSGPVQVEIDYISKPARQGYWNAQDRAWEIADLPAIAVTRTFDATATGASLTWSTTGNNAREGGIERITSIRVRRQNSSGVWTTVLEQTNPAAAHGRSLSWDRPTGADSWQLVPVFEYAVHGSSSYAELPIIVSTTQFTVDIDPLGAGNFDYRITYRIGGRTTAQQTGSLNITNGSSSTQWQVTVQPSFVPQPAAAVGAVIGLAGGANAFVTGSGGAQLRVEHLANGRERYRYAGNNVVTLIYEEVTQPFYVEIQYYKENEQQSPLPIYTYAPGTAYSSSASVTVQWDASTDWVFDNPPVGGLAGVVRVRLIAMDGTVLRDTAPTAVGARIRWPDPHPANGATFEYWDGSTWVRLQELRAGGQITVGVGHLSGTYQYRIRHYRYGNGEDFAASVATGTFTVGSNVAVVNTQNNVMTAELGGVHASGSRVQWSQPADPGDRVEFEYFDGTWHRVPAQFDGSNYYFDFASFSAISYEYRVKYYHGDAPDPYRWARGTATVSTSTTNQPAQVTLTPLSNVTFPSQHITTAQLNGDTLSWNHPREGTGVVRLTYNVAGTEYSVNIDGSGPAFQYTLSNVPEGQRFVTYRIEYLRVQQTDPYAEASGSILMTVSYPAVPPNITIQSQVPEYPSGLQQIATPTQSGSNALAWSTPADPGDEVIFRYRSVGGGAWTELAEQPNGQGYLVDLTPVAANAAGITYAFEILYKRNGATNPYAGTAGTFTLTRTANVTGTMINPVSPSAPTLVERTPSQSRTMDRWGNAILVTDTAGNDTKYRYGHWNQLLVTEGPEVRVVATNLDVNGDGIGDGQVLEQRQAPVSRNHYDLLGRLIATQDANGNVNRLAVNAAGQTIAEMHADGGVRQLRYDAFGAVTSTLSEMGYETRYVYDGAGRLTSVTREADTNSFETNNTARLITDAYAYDEAGRRISETNGENETTRYYYDLQDNLVRRRTHLNADTEYEYDAQGNKILERNALGRVMTWSHDYFSRLQRHVDLAGVEYTYSYAGRFAGLLQSQTSTGGQSMTFLYDAAGQLTTINDTGVGRIVDYSYDFAGRRSREKVRIDGLTYQDTSIEYDELNRIRGLSDLRYDLTYSYDAQGNRTHIAATYYDHERQQRTQDLWYTYDGMNRVLISQGVNNFGQIEIGTTQGTRLEYDAGGRRISSVTHGQLKILEEESSVFDSEEEETVDKHTYRFITDADGVKERYVYDGLDRLTQIHREGEHRRFTRGQDGSVSNRIDQVEYLISDREYDKASREIRDATAAIEGTDLAERIRTSSYDDDGRLTYQLTQKKIALLPYRDESRIDYQYDAANVLRSYDVKVYGSNGALEYTTYYTNDYRLGDSYQDAGQQVLSISANGGQMPGWGSTTRTYNVNGELISFTDNRGAQNNRYFANGANGQALLVVQGNIGDVDQAFANALSRADNGNRSQYFFFAHGQAVGSFGQLQNEAGRFEANFDVNYTPVSAEYPSSAPASVVAQAGDTLRIIAARIFGDPGLWYLLAEANGLTDPDAAIIEGTVIKVPNEVISLSNSAGSFKPFDVTAAIGDTTPTQPLPPPPKKKGCGVIGQILVIVVAVVVAYFTAGAVAGAIGTTAGSTGGMTVAGAVGAAAGSVASQGVAIATGMQDGFSWSSVAASALTGGLLQGTIVGNLFGSNASFGQAILQGAVNSTVNQGINVALGLQSSFSWREIAISGLSSAVSVEVSQRAGGAMAARTGNTNSARFAGSVSSSVASALVRRSLGGRMDSDAVLADVFGNAIGNSIVDRMAPQAAQSHAQGGSADALQEVQITPRYIGPDADRANARLDNNPINVIRSGSGVSPDDVRSIESITVEGQRIRQGDDAGLDQWYFLNQYYRPNLTQQGRDSVDDARYAAEDNYRTLQRYGRYNLGALNTVGSTYDVLAGTPTGTGAANLAFGYGSSVVGPSSFTQLATWAGENNVGTRVLGGLQALGGIAEGAIGGTLIATGVATSEVGVGIPIAAGGVALWALGADQTSTGLRRMLTGQYQPSAVEQTAMWAGATPQQAAWIDAGLNVYGTTKSAAVIQDLRAVAPYGAAGEAAVIGNYTEIAAGQSWKGAGPIPGTFGVGPGTESVKGLQNFYPRKGAVEFVYDPKSSTFVVGNGQIKHAALAESIDADVNSVVGGIFTRGPNGSILTNERSGHFWQNWTPQVRHEYTEFMRSRGLNVIHSEGM